MEIFLLLWLILLQVISSIAITISAPGSVEQCAAVKFSWQGGTPPYSILFNTTASVENADFVDDLNADFNVNITMALRFSNIPGTSYSQAIYFPVNSKVNLQVTDSTNSVSNQALFTVTDGGLDALCEVKFINAESILTMDPVQAHYQPLTLEAPAGPDPCDGSFRLYWYGSGFPPYTAVVRSVGVPIIQEQIFANFSSSSPYIQIALGGGIQLEFEIGDDIGQTSTSSPVNLRSTDKYDSYCIISNITSSGSSISLPTTTPPFPSFYPLSASPTTTPAFTTSRSTHTASPLHTSAYGGGDDQDGVDNNGFGTIIGIAVGIPLGVAFLTGLIGLLLAFTVVNRRKKLLQPYWMQKQAVSTGTPYFLNPR